MAVRMDILARRVNSKIGMIAFVAACLALAGLVLLTAVDVVLRYIFKAPLGFSGDVGAFVLVSVVFLGLSATLEKDRHIRVELFWGRFSPTTQARLELAMSILAMAAYALITLQAWKMGMKAIRIGTVTWGYPPVPVYPPMILASVGAGLLCLHLLLRIVDGFRRLFGLPSFMSSPNEQPKDTATPIKQ